MSRYLRLWVIVATLASSLGTPQGFGSDVCPFLLWNTFSDDQTFQEYYLDVEAHSIFEVLGNNVEPGIKVRLEGRLLFHDGPLYLVPAGSTEYVKTFSDRIEIRQPLDTRLNEEDLVDVGIVMVIGRLSRQESSWVIFEPKYMRSLNAASEACVNEQ